LSREAERQRGAERGREAKRQRGREAVRGREEKRGKERQRGREAEGQRGRGAEWGQWSCLVRLWPQRSDCLAVAEAFRIDGAGVSSVVVAERGDISMHIGVGVQV
jgi:hypothetical protein